MTFERYQELARRTQNRDLNESERLRHALWGLSAEVGEVCGLFQKTYQGHDIVRDDVAKEIGDCFWMLGELCDVMGFDMGGIAEQNIEKLRRRYPHGFSEYDSLHRTE